MRFAVSASMGLSQIAYRRFLPWSALGAVMWSVYTCGLAYLVATTLSGYPLGSIVISAVVTSIFLVAIFFVYRRRQERAARREPPDGVSLPETGAPLSSLTWEERFKLRRSLSRSVWPIPTAFIVAVEHHLDLLDAAAARGFGHPQERAAASVADANGLGGGVPADAR